MAGASGAVRAGAAFVEIFSTDSGLRKGLDAAEARVRAFGGKMAKAGAAIAGAGAVVSGPLAIAKKFAIDSGAEVFKLARDLGTTAEELTAFGAAAASVGVPFDELNGYLASLPGTLSRLADGSDASADMLRRLGVPARELINLPFAQQMEMLAEAVKGVKNPIDQVRVAEELLGAAGRDLLPLLNKGAKGVRELTDAAKASGNVITSEQAEKAAASQAALTSAWEAGKNAVVEIGMAMLPSAATVVKLQGYFLDGAAAVREFIRENGAAIGIVSAVATGLVAVGTALVTVGGLLAAAATAIGGFISVAGGIVAAIVSPLGLVVVIVAAIVVAFVAFTDAGEQACDAVGEAFDGLKETFGAAWSAIVGAVQAGDLTAAFAVVTSLLGVMLARAIVKMLGAWNDFKGFFVDAWHDGMMLVELGMEAASTAIAKTMMDMLAFIAKNFSDTFNAIVEGAAKVAEALNATETAATIRGAKDLVKLDTDGMKKIIEDDHQAANKKIFKDRGAQQDASDASRAGDMKGAKADLATAEKAFADALGVAVEAAENDEKEKREKGGPAGKVAGKPDLPKTLGELPSLSKGTFTSTSYGQMFAAPSVAGRQLREAEKTNDKLDKVIEAVEGGDKKAAVFK